MRPIASFLVPAYNEERHIGKCVDSLIAQTVPDFEVIIVDDGSTDNTPAILRNYNEGSITNKFNITIPQQMFMRYCERVRRRGGTEPRNYEEYMALMMKGTANKFLYKIEYISRWLRIYLRRY